ncbi:MAG: phosphatidate cytidylyltransferase [Epsilonproteobacteria bacterium]|nr:phosphatidate cytidylyltransferase [Campylobacterota bacterium]
MKIITENRERWITGIALLVVTLIVGYIDDKTLMWLYLGAFYLVGFNEAVKLFDVKQKSPYIYAVIIWIIAYFYPNPDDLFFLMAIFFGAKLAYTQEHVKKKLILPFLYPAVGFLFIFMLYTTYGIEWLIWLLLIVVFADVGAFLVGKSIGKTPFSPSSPNKTLEGVFGGIMMATVAGTFFAYSIDLDTFIVALIISLATAIASVFGDLFESYLKREAGVKDSGTLLPGHGGVLDRLDGYLFGSVIMLIILRAI